MQIGPNAVPTKAHRALLASASDNFKGMFREGTMESMEKEIRLPCVDVESMKIVLDFLYTGKVTWTKVNVYKVALLGNYFGSKHLVDECSKMIESCMNKQNCVSILRFADKYNLDKLREKGKSFVLDNFEEVCKSNLDFVKLSVDLLIELVESPEAVICDNNPEENEKQLFKLLWDSIEWMEGLTKRNYLRKILEAIHLPTIGEQYLNYMETKVCLGQRAKALIEKAKNISKQEKWCTVKNDEDVMNWWASLRSGSTVSVKKITNTVNLQEAGVKYFPAIFLNGKEVIGSVYETGSANKSVKITFWSDVPLKGNYHIKYVRVGNASKMFSGTLNPSKQFDQDDWKNTTNSSICSLDAFKSKVGDADVEVHVTISPKEK